MRWRSLCAGCCSYLSSQNLTSHSRGTEGVDCFLEVKPPRQPFQSFSTIEPSALSTDFSPHIWSKVIVMTKMEGLLFKNVTDGFPACSAWKREMVLINEPIYSKLFLLWVCCVLFDSLFPCRGDISPSWCDMVRQCMSSLGHISILFHFYFWLLN